MLDPRIVGTGIQTGRSLAKEGPPIQEMLGIRMQQNQEMMEIMKEVMKQHSSNLMSLQKMKFGAISKHIEKMYDENKDYDPYVDPYVTYMEAAKLDEYAANISNIVPPPGGGAQEMLAAGLESSRGVPDLWGNPRGQGTAGNQEKLQSVNNSIAYKLGSTARGVQQHPFRALTWPWSAIAQGGGPAMGNFRKSFSEGWSPTNYTQKGLQSDLEAYADIVQRYK